MIRSWLGNNEQQGQNAIHELGWKQVVVKRMSDGQDNVGVDAEYQPDIQTFTVQARIDVSSKQTGGNAKQKYTGLVEYHMLPLMSKGDRWLTDDGTGRIVEYKVTKIKDDVITLEIV